MLIIHSQMACKGTSLPLEERLGACTVFKETCLALECSVSNFIILCATQDEFKSTMFTGNGGLTSSFPTSQNNVTGIMSCSIKYMRIRYIKGDML